MPLRFAKSLLDGFTRPKRVCLGTTRLAETAATLAALPAARSRIHGDGHWRAVAATGLWLIEHAEPQADPYVVAWFGLLHDSRRERDASDPEHGARAADHLRQTLPEGLLSSAQVDDLSWACRWHSHGYLATHPTVAACWDADRLCLCRLGIRPDPEKLSLRGARTQEAADIAAAFQRESPDWDCLAAQAGALRRR